MNKILVETSARHVHVTKEDLEKLFGAGHELTVKSWLSQPGQFASEEQVDVVGPAGEVEVTEGVIAAKRHIHMTPADAEAYGVKDKDVVSVKVETAGRALTFGDVVVRVSEKFSLAMHIDTDESNAACAVNGTMGELIK